VVLFSTIMLGASCTSPASDADCSGTNKSCGSQAESPDTPPIDDGTTAEQEDTSGTSDSTETGTPPEDSGAPPEDPPTNLLADPGFEAGEAPWSIWGGATRVDTHAHTGDWALQATTSNGAEQVVTGLEPNATYRLSGWGRTDGPDPMLIGVKDHGGEEQALSFTDTDYQEDALTFTTGLSNTTAVIYVYKHTGATPGHADDLTLTLEGRDTRSPVWADEFDSEGALDATKWTFESGFVRNEELQWYQSDNAFQEDGLLVIEGRTEDRANPNYDPDSTSWRTSRERIEYTSASVTTKDLFSFQYGTLVVRAKVTNHTGTWPAIWTLGTSCEWPSNGEVDVMENYGGNILANFAWGTDARWSAYWDATAWPVTDFGAGWTDDFHIWELTWDATHMAIRLDGALLNDVSLSDTINGTANCSGQNPFQQPHFVLLNLALGGAGGSVSELSFPTRYLVDYVRVYE